MNKSGTGEGGRVSGGENDENTKYATTDENTKYAAADENTKYAAADENTKYAATDENTKYAAVDENTKYAAADDNTKYAASGDSREHVGGRGGATSAAPLLRRRAVDASIEEALISAASAVDRVHPGISNETRAHLVGTLIEKFGSELLEAHLGVIKSERQR